MQEYKDLVILKKISATAEIFYARKLLKSELASFVQLNFNTKNLEIFRDHHCRCTLRLTSSF